MLKKAEGIIVLFDFIAPVLDERVSKNEKGLSMVKTASKDTFYSIPTGTWYMLREKFKQKLPNTVTVNYVSSAVNIEDAASSAALLTLKSFGILNSNNEPTDLAYDWRDDEKYEEVCTGILNKEYPQELLDLYHSKDSTLPEVKSWFTRAGKLGDSAATKAARTYLLLLNGKLKDVKKPKVEATAKPKQATKPTNVGKKAYPVNTHSNETETKHTTERDFSAKLHLDIQIHISPDSSADQIDKIFESMSKHLKGL